MGTNYYIQKVEPVPVKVRPSFHVCKTSCGWTPRFQDSTDQMQGLAEISLPLECPEVRSAADIRRVLESGEWYLADEYGRSWCGCDAMVKFDELCGWRGGNGCENPNDELLHGCYRDPEGFIFTDRAFW